MKKSNNFSFIEKEHYVDIKGLNNIIGGTSASKTSDILKRLKILMHGLR
ncbi:hypothetical protein [Pediococcus ethanolidurans]|nr:hypothetical protein [Pediococcus ethanolidurans]